MKLSHTKWVLVLLALLMLAIQPLAAQDAGSARLLSFDVSYGGRVYDDAVNQTTFTYVVTGVDPSPDLSHFSVEIPFCAPPLFAVGTVPASPVQFGADPTTGVDGIKWDLPLQAMESRTYSISFQGNIAEGSILVGMKADDAATVTMPGPSCETASLDVDKFISTDGVNWDDSDDAPGIEVASGDSVYFRFVLTNIGNVDLSSITLSDSVYDVSSCGLPATLAVEEATACEIGPFPAQEGQIINVATATGMFGDQLVIATDAAYYFSGDLPALEFYKEITKNGGTTWKNSIKLKPGREISYKFTLVNVGNVGLSGLTLSDSNLDASSCALPETLPADETFECVVGPMNAGEADLVNTATVTATFGDETLTLTDTASYTINPDEDESEIIIVIEGPIEEIIEIDNQIIIFGFIIEIDGDDPIWRQIRIGDIIRVEGDMFGDGDTIIIIPVNIIIINVTIIINNIDPSPVIVVPPGCKLTGIGKGSPRLKCTKKRSSKRSS